MGTERRKIILINSNFQVKLIIKFLILNTVLIGIFASVFYFFFNSRIAHSAIIINDMLIRGITIVSLIDFLVSSIIISFIVLISSHKLAGPIYRFKTALQEMSMKNFSIRTELRYNDQYYPCSEELSKLSDVLSADIKKIKKKINLLKESTQSNNINKKELLQHYDELNRLLDQYTLKEHRSTNTRRSSG